MLCSAAQGSAVLTPSPSCGLSMNVCVPLELSADVLAALAMVPRAARLPLAALEPPPPVAAPSVAVDWATRDSAANCCSTLGCSLGARGGRFISTSIPTSCRHARSSLAHCVQQRVGLG